MTGSLIMTDSGPIVWASHQQKTLALSSCESELIAAVSTIQLLLYFQQLTTELGHSHKATLKIDNKATQSLVSQSQYRQRTKHISVRYLFVRDLVESGKIAIEHVASEDQLADFFTEALSKSTFQRLRALIGISAH